MVWDYPSEPREPKYIPPRDEDELYQEWKDRRLEEEWDTLVASQNMRTEP